MLTRIVIIAILFSSCSQLRDMGCPAPERVKLRKASAHRMKYYRIKQRELAAERTVASKDYTHVDIKDLRNLEEWDCPRPGSRHDRLIKDKRKRIEKKYQTALRKHEKDVKPMIPGSESDGSN
jgi:hypothetical protein